MTLPARLRSPLLVLVCVLATGALAACGSASGASCASTDKTGPCRGTFTCSNGGITISCDKATQACVIAPGMIDCVTVSGASSTSCPSPMEAASVAGCTTPFMPACNGSASSGITITCKQ